ncbi:MAG TPA: phosphoenolpyruvate carboxylase, partial [Candidatus Udaeobacter sp.]|nr:phosphoenolpyruvate carboxylase [Candidatus Udaeobacter sp.]
GEPHRQFLLFIADRIPEGRADELMADLRLLQESLASAGAVRLAYGEVQNLLWQAETFGFHFAQLEVRQHSRHLERALAEIHAGDRRSPETQDLLDTFEAISEVQARFGVDACRRFVVSFTQSARDIANVYELASLAVGELPVVLDAVPLFETQQDLRGAVSLLDEIIALPPVRKRLAANGRRYEVMLGYSDSAKEVGPVAATLALYEAQAALARWAARRRIKLTIFHGRGGALGRGGGPANRAVRAQAPGSVAGRFKVTEQGEVIFARYGNRAIARRHLEQVTSAVLEASTAPVRLKAERSARRFRTLAAQVGDAARIAYRRLIEAPGFEEWFARVSPIEELSRMRVGSRPTHRGGRRSFEELRAIPWVFAWSQTRLNLPGWFGLGSGLSAATTSELREAYARWPLFNVLIDNAEMSLAKTDRLIAARYLALGDRQDLTELVLAEYDLSLSMVLAVTGHKRLLEDKRVLSWAIELRNPYVDALSHLQLTALRAVRQGRGGKAAERLLMLTINGVAAGLQNTG